jgi:hypothetical protein
MRESLALTILLAAAVTHADPGADHGAADAAVRSTTDSLLTALAGTEDASVEAAFAPTVKLVKVDYATDACTKALGRKKSVRGPDRARVARCLFDAAAVPAPGSAYVVTVRGRTMEVTLGGHVLRFRKRGAAVVIDRIESPQPPNVALLTERNRATLDSIINNAQLHDLGAFNGLDGRTGEGSADGGTGTAVATPGTVASGTTTGDLGGYTADEIDRVVKSHAGAVRACYQKALASTPGLAGKLVVTFQIDGDGAVTSTTIAKGSTLVSKPARACIQAQLMRLAFPPKAVSATVTYPFVFSAGG